MKDRDDGMIRGFTVLSQAYSGEVILRHSDYVDEITVGYYGADGDCGTTGEFCIVWVKLDKIVPQLQVFDDAWRLLAKWPDFVALLAELNDSNITPADMAVRLERIGFVDRTQRKRGDE